MLRLLVLLLAVAGFGLRDGHAFQLTPSPHAHGQDFINSKRASATAPGTTSVNSLTRSTLPAAHPRARPSFLTSPLKIPVGHLHRVVAARRSLSQGRPKAMAPPPKIVHSVVVTNAMSAAVNVQVAFDNHKEKIELLEEHRIEPGASWDFAEKTLDMGSWTAVAPVKKITVLQANGPAHVLEPEVSQIVKKLKVKVQDDGTLLQEGEA